MFLLGHIAVPYSGDYTDDGHDTHQGAQPADLYYVDVDGPWTDSTANTGTPAPTWAWNVNTYSPPDGKFDQNEIPIVGINPGVRKVELQIGRVDFSRFVNWGVARVLFWLSMVTSPIVSPKAMG